ncbi:MAG TPA: M56 family metallopeptidase [Bryobacteraceae bacterium]|jgi:uncharacterized protein (TIGR03435 family)
MMLSHLLDTSIRSLILALAAAGVLWILRSRRTAALQHAVWTAVVCGMLALVAFGEILPRLPLRILTNPAAAPPRSASPLWEAPPSEGALDFPAPALARPQRSTDWSDVAIYAYAAVAFAFLARFLMGMFLVRRLLKQSSLSGAGFLESEAIAVPLTVGWLRPKILLPMEWREWDREKLDAVLAHEGSHVRRRDGLVSALAGINLRLLAELACDESSVATLGDREGYARLLLDMARVVDTEHGRLQSHALTMAASSHIRQRIDSLLQEGRSFSRGLTWTGWAAIALCGIPIVFGAGAVTLDRQPPVLPLPMPRLSSPAPPILLAQAQTAPPAPASATTPAFEVASIKPCTDAPPGVRSGTGSVSPGRLSENCLTVKSLITTAYVLFANGQHQPSSSLKLLPVEGGPAWLSSDRYSIDARAEGPANPEMMQGPMLQALLEDRFKLRVRRETREVPVYALTVAKGGLKLQQAEEGSCTPRDIANGPAPHPQPGQKPFCGQAGLVRKGSNFYWELRAMTLDEFSKWLNLSLDRLVIDKTGAAGNFDFHLEFAPDETTPGLVPGGAEPSDPTGPSIFTAVQEQLGLKLEPAKGPGEFLVIDHIEKPSEN